MPICIECCYPVSHLYTTYSKADDRTLGKGVRLTQCPRCQRFADKYVEHDFVVLFIDLVLIKPQVYRHLLFNRLGRDDDKFDRSIIRLGILTLLFDVYLSWARLESSAAISSSSLASAHIIVQYFFFLTLNTLATVAHHATVRIIAAFLVPLSTKGQNSHNNTDVPTPGDVSTSSPATPVPQTQSQTPTPTAGHTGLARNGGASPSADVTQSSFASGATLPLPSPDPLPPLRRSSTAPIPVQPMPPPAPASPNAISTALLVSSCTKLFPILLVIWGSDSSDSASLDNNQNTSTAVASTSLARKLLKSTAQSRPDSGSLATTSSQTLSASPVPSSTSTARAQSSFQSWASSPFLQPFLSLIFSVSHTHLVLLNNIEALFILLDCGYIRAASMALGGQMARWLVERAVLNVVGL